MRSDGLPEPDGPYSTDWDERFAMREWLADHCRSVHEFDFWFAFYDDLEDCFDDLEPWRMRLLMQTR